MDIVWTMQDMKLVELSWPKKREYLKDQINELETNSKNKNIRNLCSGRNLLLYPFRRRVIKWTVVIIKYHCY
jgi:hypothetical protein